MLSVAVKGRITLDGNSLRVKNSTIALEDIRGELLFDDEGLEGDDLKARLYGKPARARVWSEAAGGVTNVSLDGPLAPIANAADLESLMEKNPGQRGFYSLLLDVRNAISEILDNTSLAEILRRNAVAGPDTGRMASNL